MISRVVPSAGAKKDEESTLKLWLPVEEKAGNPLIVSILQFYLYRGLKIRINHGKI